LSLIQANHKFPGFDQKQKFSDFNINQSGATPPPHVIQPREPIRKGFSTIFPTLFSPFLLGMKGRLTALFSYCWAGFVRITQSK
jgi:hypothetical protein